MNNNDDDDRLILPLYYQQGYQVGLTIDVILFLSYCCGAVNYYVMKFNTKEKDQEAARKKRRGVVAKIKINLLNE